MRTTLIKTILLALGLAVVCALPAPARTPARSLTDLPVRTVNNSKYYFYKTKKGDTLYSLAQAFGISRNDILDYNPYAADGIKPGMTLTFPVADFENYTFTTGAANDETQESTTTDDNEIRPIVDEISTMPLSPQIGRLESSRPVELNVAVCLPFALASEKPEKNAVYATDFYRGLLLGIDSLRTYYGNPSLRITAVDTENPKFIADSQSALSRADIIVAPENLNTLQELGKFGIVNDAFVLNTFQTRDTTFTHNPFMLQGNITAAEMYDKAIDYFISHLDGATPVFLENESSRKDKQQFTDALAAALLRAGIDYKNFKYDGVLTSTSISDKLPASGVNFVFIPTSGSLNDFHKFATALAGYKETVALGEQPGNVRLFAYPEYTRFTGDALDKLKSIGTTFYSRFYNDPASTATSDFRASFADRYGTDIPDGVPNQALYGFDVARWLLNLASQGAVNRQTIIDAQTTDGIQTNYRFNPLDNGGLCNDVLFMVTLRENADPLIELL